MPQQQAAAKDITNTTSSDDEYDGKVLNKKQYNSVKTSTLTANN